MRTNLLLIIMFLSLVSCKKETKDSQSINIINSETFIFGDTINFERVSFSEPSLNHYYVDFDEDSIVDIKLESSLWTSPIVNTHIISTISCLNPNCKILGNYQNDTIFHKTIIKLDGSKHYYYSCKKEESDYTVDEIIYNNFKIIPKNFGEEFETNNVFNADTITLYGGSCIYSTVDYYNGIPNLIREYYDYSCDELPLDIVKYIGIKIKISGIEKLGWIKLIVNSANDSKISVLEIAIQK